MAKTAVKKQKICKAAESVAQVVQNTQLQVAYHFPCPVYLIERPDFLDMVNNVSEESLEAERQKRVLDEIYPVYMTGSYFADQRLTDFTQFVGSTAWNILNEQGYAMQDRAVSFTEMWTQEHYKHSAMEQHTHKNGVQIVGFYFLKVPENSSKVLFHDPRAGKVQIDLPEQDASFATPASSVVNFDAKPGLFIFTNAWLAHSFSRHASDKALKFVHFNLTVIPAPRSCEVPAEVI